MRNLPPLPTDLCLCEHARSCHKGLCAGYIEKIRTHFWGRTPTLKESHTCPCLGFKRVRGAVATAEQSKTSDEVLGNTLTPRDLMILDDRKVAQAKLRELASVSAALWSRGFR